MPHSIVLPAGKKARAAIARTTFSHGPQRSIYRLRTVRIGVAANFAVVFLLAVLPFLPSSIHFDRIPYFGLLGTGLGLAGLVALLPWQRIVESPLERPMLYVWTIGNVLLITLALPFTGGASSELFYLYTLTTIFWSASYPPREQALLFLFTLGCYGVVLGLSSSTPQDSTLALRLGVLAATAYLAGFLAREMARQVAVNDHLAHHDALTGLPNRTLFHECLQQALEGDAAVGVILADLDRFREVNNVLGHGHGDRLLQQIGPRLASVLRPNDLVARHGGDEFTVLLAESGGAPGVAETAQRLLRALHEPFVIDGISLAVEASIGIAVSPIHGRDPETLIGRADGAMYAAKAARSGYEFYVPDQDDLSAERLGLLADIRRAIEQRELVVHYQPIVELATGRFAGVEALVRWQHPERGLLLPDDFIPLVEQTSLIRPLTLYVLEEALRVGAGLKGDIPVSVNLSMRALYDRGLSSDVAVLLARAGFPAERLQLEITESALMENPVRSLDVLSELSRLGIRLTVDDFGTGYSSLAHLTELPVDGVKIDKSFVLSMRESSSDTVIVRSVLNIGRNLGLEVVAEGVETAAACADLKALGCRLAQGFYFSVPLPPDDLTDWVAARAA